MPPSREAASPTSPDDLRRWYESAMQMFERLSLGVLWYDPERRCVSYANEAALVMLESFRHQLGFPAKSLRGRKLDRLLAGQEDLLAALSDPHRLPQSARLESAERTVELKADAVTDARGVFCGVQLTLTDITERLSRTRQLRDKTSRLEAALARQRELELLRRDVTAMVAQEFRTPLAMLDRAAKTLAERETLTAGGRDELRKLRRAARRLSELLQESLAASALDAGGVTLRQQACDLLLLAGAACDAQAAADPEHPVERDLEGLAGRFQADPNFVTFIVGHLLSNAAKFSPPGSPIRVTGRREGRRLAISVADEGLGIAGAELARVGERFFRAATARGVPGTGVGLNLCRQLAERHGGAIELQSQVGRGTTAILHLPAQESEAEQELFHQLLSLREAG